METEDSRVINNYLAGLYKVPLREDPLFRLVWSEDVMEIRKGTFNEFYGHIFVREVIGVRRVRKYSYIKDRWIMEQWYPPSLVNTDELPESRMGSYEPLYVFQDKYFNPLPLQRWAVDIIVQSVMRPKSSQQAIKSRTDNEFYEKERREDRFFDTMINDSVLDLQLHFGEAGLVPSNFYIDAPNLRRKKNGRG